MKTLTFQTAMNTYVVPCNNLVIKSILTSGLVDFKELTFSSKKEQLSFIKQLFLLALEDSLEQENSLELALENDIAENYHSFSVSPLATIARKIELRCNND